MLLRTRPAVVATCLAIGAAACGGTGDGPAAPSSLSSSMAGATIAGTVSGAAAPERLMVAVAGTQLSSAVERSGSFRIENVPAGNVNLQFTDGAVSAAAQLANVSQEELIRIQVQLNGVNATIVSEQRTLGKVTLCHKTESGAYHSIEVSANAEPAHRAHGDGKVGEPVPADPSKTFGPDCQPSGASVNIEKSTNGEDADSGPGPTLPVGSRVTWEYLVTNTGSANLTNIAVVDDRGVAVSCGGQTALAAGQSMTCTGSGVAAAGQYRNVGTVTATWSGGTVTSSDQSHYFGQAATDDDGPKVQVCHRTGNGSYHLIEVSVNAEPAHRAHGDGRVGEAVPGRPGQVFDAGCQVR